MPCLSTIKWTSKLKTTVVDYGVGNIGALVNMLEYLGISVDSSGDPSRVAMAERLILPGVGAFDRAMGALGSSGMIPALNEAVMGRMVPVLGVCLGMQLMARRSDEGNESGLGWISADVRRIEVSRSSGLKVPNVGWRTVSVHGSRALFGDSSGSQRFYFTHGYHVVCDDATDVAASIDYGGVMCSAIQRKNLHGVQFHPEKSHRFGLRLLERFCSFSVDGGSG